MRSLAHSGLFLLFKLNVAGGSGLNRFIQKTNMLVGRTAGRSDLAPDLPPHLTKLGIVSFLTAMSSAMVYGVLPIFLVRVLGITIASVGLIEGAAEGGMALARILSGLASDRLGRRKPLLLLGYAVSALNKLLFPLATGMSMILAARMIDRIGKGLRDAPRDAFMTDLTPARVRGSGFGLRLAFYTMGYVAGPLLAMAVMEVSGDNFRLVFWIAVIPAALAIVVLVLGIQEIPPRSFAPRPLKLRRHELSRFAAPFWRAIAVASLLSLARFSHAFLLLKAHGAGLDSAYVPLVLILMHLVYAAAAYPFGVLADRIDRHRQLMLGAGVLIFADIVLASAAGPWVVMIGAGFWGLQFAVTQGLLAAAIADSAPAELRGTAFGIFDFAVGTASFIASAAAGALWVAFGPEWTFAVSAAAGLVAMFVSAVRPGSGASASARVFVALKMKSELAEELAGLSAGVEKFGVRRIPASDIHLTIVPPWNETSISDAVVKLSRAAAAHAPFELKFRRVCYGPERRHPRLLWVECKASSELVALRNDLLMAFEVANDRQFRPHVTLGRVRRLSASLSRNHSIKHDLALSQQVSSVELMQSPPQGARGYTVLASVPLAGSAVP